MELGLEVISSVSIKRKKPWPKFSWLGDPENSYGLYMMDSHRLSQLSLKSGKTKRKFQSLASIQSQIALTSSSSSGSILGGLTSHGDLFLWHQATKVVETFITPLSKLSEEKVKLDLNAFQGHKLFISDSGEQALLLACPVDLYLWELDSIGRSYWWKLFPPEGVILAKPSFREAIVDACFHVHPVLGECCSCVFVHTSRDTQTTVITNLLINWKSAAVEFYSQHTHSSTKLSPAEGCIKPAIIDQTSGSVGGEMYRENAVSSKLVATSNDQQLDSDILKDRTNLPSTLVEHSVKETAIHSDTVLHSSHSYQYPVPAFSTKWRSISHSSHSPPLTGRGCYVGRFSPAGSIIALAVNAREPSETRLLFFPPFVEAGLSHAVYTNENKGGRKSGRTYWLADMAWSADGLLLVCVTRRGSLMIAPRFGQPIKLLAHGCSLDMESSYYLPLHPLISVIGPTRNVTNHETSQSSERDALRQRFSVATHPLLPVLLCSDGYSLTVLSYSQSFSLVSLAQGLVASSRDLLGLPPLRDDVASRCDANEEVLQKDRLLHELGGFNETGVDFESTLASTFTGTGLLMGLSGVDAGALHFAGVSSDLDGTQTSVFSHTLQQKHNIEQSVAQLLTAWGLILSSSLLEPGNGSFPLTKPLKPTELKPLQSKLQHLSNAVVSTIVSVTQSGLALGGHVDSQEVILTALDLVPLDSVMQSKLQVVASLVNAFLMVLLGECVDKHRTFRGLKQHAHTLQSMREFVEDVVNSVSSISELLHNAVSIIESTYSVSSTSTLPAFHSPMEAYIKPQLAPLLSSLVDVLKALWNDVKSCAIIAETTLATSSQSSRFQSREIGLLFENLASSLGRAVGVIQSTIALKEELLPASITSNPITSKLEDQGLANLLMKLENYELRDSLELAHSFLKQIETEDVSQQLQSLTQSLTHSDSFLAPSFIENFQSANLEIASEQGTLVIGCLAELMTAFFTNQRLLFPIPSNQTTPLQQTPQTKTTEESHVRCLELDRCKVAVAVREQGVSEYWTADHTLELLMLCGMWEEAFQFVSKLGDWKKAFLLASAYIHHGRIVTDDSSNLSPLETLACRLAEDNIICLLGVQTGDPIKSTQFEPHSKEVKRAISNTFYVCALAKFDCVLMDVTSTVVCELTRCCRLLPAEVPSQIYLPAPPLYCPQPTPSNEDCTECPSEFNLRGRISSLIASLASILEAANCLQPCVHHYSAELQQLYSTSHEYVQVLGSPYNEGDSTNLMTGFPPSLVKQAESHSGFGELRDASAPVQKILAVFRQLCGLLWLLHCRDQASLYLHKIKPSLLSQNRNIENLKQAAVWSARLLPFSDFLPKTTNSDTEDIALSSLSELPSSCFLADLLAVTFPNSSTHHSRSLEAKLKRLVARLRSSLNTEVDLKSEPLSVRYQVKSRQVLEALNSTAVTKFRTITHDLSSEYSSPSTDYLVGSFSFEYDIEYAQFLDTVFAVLCPEEPLATSSQSRVSLMKKASLPNVGAVPCLSGFIGSFKSDEASDGQWQNMLSFLSTLSHWSQQPDPQIVHGKDRPQKSISTNSQPPSIRVNISASFVANCLRQREKRLMTSRLQGHAPSLRESEQQQLNINLSSTLEDSNSYTVLEESDQSLHLTDLERSSPAIKADLNSPCSDEGVDEVDGKSTVEGQPSLLHIPEGILQGQLSLEVVQSVLDVSKLSPRTSPEKTQRKALKPSGENLPTTQRDIETPTLEIELTESISTGEFPSGMTLSFGEFRSRREQSHPSGLDTLQSTVELTLDIPLETETPKQSYDESDSWNGSTTQPDDSGKSEQSRIKAESSNQEQAGDRRFPASISGRESSDIDFEHSETDDSEDTITPSSVTLTEDTREVATHEANHSDTDKTLDGQDTLTEVSRQLSEPDESMQSRTESIDAIDGPHSNKDIPISAQSIAASSSTEDSTNRNGSAASSDEVDGVAPSVAVAQPSLVADKAARGDDDTSNAAIGKIVRAEMKKILQLQQQQVMSLLDVVASESSLQDPAPEEKLEVNQPPLIASSPVPPNTSDARATSTVPPSNSNSESMAPMLNLEDLQSSSDDLEHPTHITINISATQSQLDVEASSWLQQASPNEPHTNQPSVVVEQSVKAIANGSDKTVDLHLSELGSQTYSPGAILPLSSSGTSFLAKNERVGMKKAQPGLFSQVKQTGRYGEVPLLQFSPKTVTEQKTDDRTLDCHYPGLSRNLKLFGDSITGMKKDDKVTPNFPKTSSPFPFLTLQQNTETTQAQATQAQATQAQTTQAQTTQVQAPETFKLYVPWPGVEKADFQLLQLPDEAHSLPGMINQSSNVPLLLKLPLQAPPTNQPHPLSKPQATPMIKPHPLSRPQFQPHPLSKSKATSTNPPHQFPYCKPPLHPPPTAQDFVLPQVPLHPFIPKLIPPSNFKPSTTDFPVQGSYPLLKLDGPLTRMKKDGFKLLQLPQVRKDEQPRLLQMPTDEVQTQLENLEHVRVQLQHSHAVPQQVMEDTATQAQVSSSLTSISETTLSGSSRKESDVVIEPLAPHQSTRHLKPKTKKKKRAKQVTWKHGSPEPPQENIHPSHNDFQTLSDSENAQVEQPKIGHKRPLKLKASTEPQTYPDYVPLDQLEVRRLDIHSSFLSSCSHSEGEEKVDATITLAKDSQHKQDNTDVQSPKHTQSKKLRSQSYPRDVKIEVEHPEDSVSQHVTKSESRTAVNVPTSSHQFISVVDISELHDNSDLASSSDSTTSPSNSKLDSIALTQEKTKQEVLAAAAISGITHISETGSVSDLPLVSEAVDDEVEGVATATTTTTTDALTENLLRPSQPQKNVDAQMQFPHSVDLHGRPQVLERLRLLEQQLDAIESTAKMVEGEFRASNQILHTIDHLQTVTEAHLPSPHPTARPPHLLSPVPLTGDLPHPSQTRQSSVSDSSPPHLRDLAPNELDSNPGFGVDRDDNKSTRAHGEKHPTLVNDSFKSDVPQKPTDVELPMTEPPIGGASMTSGADWSKTEKLHAYQPKKSPKATKMSTKRKGQVKFAPGQQERTLSSTFQNRRSTEKRDREKRHLEQRIHDAFALMSDMLNSKPEMVHHPPSQTVHTKLPVRATENLSKSVTTAGTAGVSKSSTAQSNAARLPPKGGTKLKLKRPPYSGRTSSCKQMFDSNLRNSGGFGNRKRRLSDTYTKEPAHDRNTQGFGSFHNNSLKATQSLSSLSDSRCMTATASGKIRRISSVEGLTEGERDKMADILASTEFDRHSISSGSIASTIDWDEVDRILEK